jgi:hypothetical protein
VTLLVVGGAPALEAPLIAARSKHAPAGERAALCVPLLARA